MSQTATAKTPPPKDGLVRANRPGLEIRAAEGDAPMPTLFGYLLRFNEWTEIDSLFEGRFLERILPGSAKKTLAENRDKVKILLNHGCDPHIGEKPLAKPDLEEKSDGVFNEGQLFDTTYNRDLVPGLENGQYGASFKFRVVKETWDEEPGISDYNPEGLPERSIEEIKLYEGGPVTFPAYDGASAGVRCRSLTDRVFFERLSQDPSRMPEMADLFTNWVQSDPERAEKLVAEARAAEAETTPPSTEEKPEAEKAKDDDSTTPEETPTEQPASTDEPADSAGDDALPGAENSHSDAGSRTAPWGATSNGDVAPPWRRNEEPTAPWHSREKE